MSDNKKPVFRLEDLEITPTKTPEQIKADIAERMHTGRFAEMTPHQAGINENEVIPKEVAEKIAAANKYFDENPPKAHSQEELDKLFKRS